MSLTREGRHGDKDKRNPDGFCLQRCANYIRLHQNPLVEKTGVLRSVWCAESTLEAGISPSVTVLDRETRWLFTNKLPTFIFWFK